MAAGTLPRTRREAQPCTKSIYLSSNPKFRQHAPRGPRIPNTFQSSAGQHYPQASNRPPASLTVRAADGAKATRVNC